MTEAERRTLTDLPPTLRRGAIAWSWGAMVIIVVAVVVQLLALGDLFDDPWLPMGVGFFSSAAIGVDAAVSGVRREVGVGPSIANLAPGGWALFAAMLWILALPAYFIGARRRARRRTQSTPTVHPPQIAPANGAVDEVVAYEPMTIGGWLAIVLVFAIGLFSTFAPLLG